MRPLQWKMAMSVRTLPDSGLPHEHATRSGMHLRRRHLLRMPRRREWRTLGMPRLRVDGRRNCSTLRISDFATLALRKIGGSFVTAAAALTLRSGSGGSAASPFCQQSPA